MLLHWEGLLPNLRVEHLGNGCRKARKTSRYKMEFDVVIFGQLACGWGRLLVFWWGKHLARCLLSYSRCYVLKFHTRSYRCHLLDDAGTPALIHNYLD